MRVSLLWLLFSLTKVDHDGDTLADIEEQRLLDRFLPTFHIADGDCDLKPAEFVAGSKTPLLKARNGSIYGQAFRVPGGIELHYYHLWAMDCGRIQHALDAEHVSAFLVDRNGEWSARYWYAAAHEDTVCDRGAAAKALLLHAEWRGPDVWISRGKHASFLSESICRLGCGSDRCDRSIRLQVERVINLGESERPLNGSFWIHSPGWMLAAKMRTDFPPQLQAELDRSKKITALRTANPVVQPVILAGSTAIDSLELAGTKTETSLGKAKRAVRKWFDRHLQ